VESQGYLIAWVWYLLALLVAAWLLWRGGRFLPPVWRTLVTVLPVLVLLVPWTVAEGHEALAPAWMVAVFDGTVQTDGSFWRAGKVVVLAALFSLLPVALVAWAQRRRSMLEQPQ